MIWPFSIFERKLDCSDGKDERNRNFQVLEKLPPNAVPRSMHWNCPVVLNQGREGACCGFAVTHEIIAEPNRVTTVGGSTARRMYKAAQKVDRWAGEDYEGTSLNAALKVAKSWGWYDEYRWAFGIDDLILAIGHLGPAVLGIDWYSGMARPVGGLITPTGRKTGRHAILCNGYNHADETFTLHNSWGKWWGYRGECRISKDNLEKLLNSGGTAAIPLVRNQQETK